MIIKNPAALTTISVWTPRYNKMWNDGEWEALVNCYHVRYASGLVLVDFPKAKHLKGHRFCIMRHELERCPIENHVSKAGKQIKRYIVPLSKLENWDTVSEIKEIIKELGW